MAGHKTYTLAEVHEHSTLADLWIVVHDKVYDVTAFVEEHPGGEEVILDHAGRDATDAFDEIGHSKHAMQLLKDLQIGVVDLSAPIPDSTVPTTVDGRKTSGKATEGLSTTFVLVAFAIVPLLAFIIYSLLLK